MFIFNTIRGKTLVTQFLKNPNQLYQNEGENPFDVYKKQAQELKQLTPPKKFRQHKTQSALKTLPFRKSVPVFLKFNSIKKP